MARSPDKDEFIKRPVSKRKGGTRALGQSLGRLTSSAFGRRGFAQGDVVRHWPAIVGELLARHTRPDRIMFPRGQRTGGLLHLQVGSSAVATEVQHLEPLIVEKVNTYFGYGAVRGIHIFQRPLPPPEDAGPKEPRALAPAERTALEDELAVVTDPDLHRALEALGSAIMRRRPRGG